MSVLTDKFSDLAEVLRADYTSGAKTPRPGAGGDVFLQRVLRPMLPSSIRCAQGTVVDVKDREVGPFDVVGCADGWPPIGGGAATTFLANGTIFALQARDWAVNDLTQFGLMAGELKNIDRQAPLPIFCGAISYGDIPQREIADFMNSSPGRSLDAVVVIGSHVIIRNFQGIYGDPQKVPFVTETGSGVSLKAFTFAVMYAAQSFIGQPFGLSAYQHL